jgi:hypothetical protein
MAGLRLALQWKAGFPRNEQKTFASKSVTGSPALEKFVNSLYTYQLAKHFDTENDDEQLGKINCTKPNGVLG